MLKITAIGNLTNDVELKVNETTGKPYAILRIADRQPGFLIKATEVEFLSPRRVEEAAMAAEEPDSADAA